MGRVVVGNLPTAYRSDRGTGHLDAIGKYPVGKGANRVEIVTYDGTNRAVGAPCAASRAAGSVHGAGHTQRPQAVR
nr:hypothetical protein [Burkholderia sp. IMCC1007]